ncbi:hypothetical protein OSB04_027005 [Centaurea solstitialis]|uniref:Uncharacterized protein n=1 Tax=Centaurea solstitialis TaxID=347529 RepID=A0AA38W7T6_9ASTR|nr:hypothetical protein OSB04_027005 [Centaurea solstitialis]
MILNSPTCTHTFTPKNHHHPTTTATLLPKTLFLPCGLPIFGRKIKGFSSDWGFASGKTSGIGRSSIKSSLLEAPVLWAGRVCIFYALLKAGLAGSPSNPLASTTELEGEGGDLGFSKWFAEFKGKPEKEAADKRKLVSKWHPTTKGTLRRNYRIPSKSEGRRLLKAIASLLSDDDHFRDATSHKGCQIRRESAHGETVCCNNVRALFDELPTPHLVVEITPFPAGPLTESDYARAEKLEKVLRSGPSV